MTTDMMIQNLAIRLAEEIQQHKASGDKAAYETTLKARMMLSQTAGVYKSGRPA